jgi:hypothetical protein
VPRTGKPRTRLEELRRSSTTSVRNKKRSKDRTIAAAISAEDLNSLRHSESQRTPLPDPREERRERKRLRRKNIVDNDGASG